MKLRSIPPRTCITLARKPLTRNWRPLSSINADLVSKPQNLERGKMRQQISPKPFEAKLARWQEELEELSQWAGEGFDVSKIKKSIEERIEGLLDLLEGKT